MLFTLTISTEGVRYEPSPNGPRGDVFCCELKTFKAQKIQEEPCTSPFPAWENLDRGAGPGRQQSSERSRVWDDSGRLRELGQALCVRISLCDLDQTPALPANSLPLL